MKSHASSGDFFLQMYETSIKMLSQGGEIIRLGYVCMYVCMSVWTHRI